MKEFAMLHGDTLIWAGVALVGGIFAVLKFSGGLQGLFSRVRKLPGGFELDPVATQQSSSEVSPPLSRPAESNVQPGLFPEISVRANSEKYLRDVLKTVPPEDRENYLLETLLNVTASWHFEISNFLIMGSQLALLQVLNSSAQS